MDKVMPKTQRIVAQAGAGTPPAYRPSWLDRLTAAVERLPGPALFWYLLLGAGLALLVSVLKWLDGTFPPGHFDPYHLVFVSTPVYALAVLHFLDRAAAQSLDDFRPVLDADEATEGRLRYQLTTLPAFPALLVTLGGVAGVLLVWSQLDLPTVLRNLGPILLILLLEAALSMSTWVLGSLFIYHTFHQLRVVTTIYERHTRINLFTLGPLYSFSRLTALTAVAPIAVLMLDYLGWSGRPITPTAISLWVLFGLLSAGTFVLPLLGVHRLLGQEKARAQLELSERLRALLSEVHEQAASRTATADATSATKNLLDSLLAEQALLDKVSTWPWAPETPRAVATALLLPVLLLIISELVKRQFGF